MDEFLKSFVPQSPSAFMILILVALVSFLFFVGHTHRRDESRRKTNLPQGSLGLPVVGETLSFMRAMRANRTGDWINERVTRYGHVFKTTLMGSPTVVIAGQAGNKFVLSADSATLSMRQSLSVLRVVGKHQIFQLNGSRYRQVKDAMSSFLKPDSLQRYVGNMDDLVRNKIAVRIKGNETVKAVPFLKELTFGVSCSLLFGIYDQPTKQVLSEDLSLVIEGVWSIPVYFPGTCYWQAIRARARANKLLLPIVRRRRDLLETGGVGATRDMISCLIASRDENQQALDEEEILDNITALFLASHDTTTSLASLLVWRLGMEPQLQEEILQEHIEILKERQGVEGKLTWGEVQKMKHTWRVAQELLRLFPTLFGHNRMSVKDTSFEGYDIPKGWLVMCTASTTQMDGNIFRDPMKFDPSRFRNPDKPIPPYTYIPFGAGPRMCPGNEFARIESLIIIHHLVTNFEWSLANPEEKVTCNPFPYPLKGLPIKLKQRKPIKIG